MQSYDLSGHGNTIAIFFRRELRWARSYQYSCQRYVSNLWNGWKNLLPIDKKVRRKNQISEYHAPSPRGTMRTIRDRSMKNLLTQWDTEEENRKIHKVWLVKNLLTQRELRRKTKDWQGEAGNDSEGPDLVGLMKTWLGWLGEKPPNPNGRWGRKTKQSIRWKTSQPIQEIGEENQMILEGIRTIRGGVRLYSRRRCERCVEDGYIICRGEDMSNAMRRAPSCMEEMVKVMRDGIAPLYVGDLRRRKAPSHVMEVMRAMQWEGLHPTSWRGWNQCAVAPNWWLVGVEIARSIDNYKGCFLSRSNSLGRMPSDPILQAVCLQILSFRPYAFRFT